MSDTPRMRAGHDERSRITDHLAQAYADGKLDHDEFEERTSQLMAARYVDELQPLIADLGTTNLAPLVPATGAVPALQQSPQRGLVQHDPSARPTNVSIGVFGGTDRAGHWVVGRQHVAISVFGGTSLDLREVTHTDAEIVISAWAVMGGTTIIVAPDARVVVEGFGVLGGFGWENRASSRTPAQQSGPLIRIKGLAVWGGVGVVRKPLDDDDDDD